jgi:cytoskeletal protein CcmA (bactofilin family)
VLLGGSECFAQRAGGSIVQQDRTRDDLYLAGAPVDVVAPVDGDLVVAGCPVNVDARVGGDVLAAGCFVRVQGEAMDDVRIAGGQVVLRAHVAGDATAVGGRVDLPRETRVEGKAWLAGGTVEVQGHVGRSLGAAGRTIRFGGDVDGDVDLAGGDIEILPSARVRGALVYRSPSEATIAPGAQIAGGVRREAEQWSPPGRRALRAAAWVAVAFLLGGFLVAGAVMATLLPRFTASSARTIRSDPWTSLGVGFAVLVTAPVAAVLLMATVVGAIAGFALLALYGVSVLAALLVSATSIGAVATRLFRREAATGRVLLSILAGLVVLALLQLVPFVGVLVIALAVVLGLGGWTVHGYRAYAAARP